MGDEFRICSKRGMHSCPSLPSESIVHRWESHCTMGQVNCPWESTCTWVHYIPLSPYHVGQVGLNPRYHLGPPHPTCPSYPTVPCRTGGTVQWNPRYHLGPPYPTCPSYPTVPCRTGGTVQWNPRYHFIPSNRTVPLPEDRWNKFTVPHESIMRLLTNM